MNTPAGAIFQAHTHEHTFICYYLLEAIFQALRHHAFKPVDAAFGEVLHHSLPTTLTLICPVNNNFLCK